MATRVYIRSTLKNGFVFASWQRWPRKTYYQAKQQRIGTVKLNNLDPKAYLRYVLERIADHPINKIVEQLPWTITPSALKIPLAA